MSVTLVAQRMAREGGYGGALALAGMRFSELG